MQQMEAALRSALSWFMAEDDCPTADEVISQIRAALPRREFDGRELPSSDPCFHVAASEVR